MFTLYNIIHGVEFWLATSIFSAGVAAGVLFVAVIEWLGDHSDGS